MLPPVKLCPDCRVMTDYLSWLDNSATADTAAAAYIMDKVSGAGAGAAAWSNTGAFPNFYNQFEGV